MVRWRAGASIDSLTAHPNSPEILTVLAQLPHITDADLPLLAAAWDNSPIVAEARASALEPESPLVVEVLCAFEAVQALFADDVEGDQDFVTVDPAVTAVALKAIRDAIAASYARPALSRADHALLMRAWRAVFPDIGLDEPDLGERGGELRGLLAALPRLAWRCHDADAAGDFEAILAAADRIDEAARVAAAAEAWRAAVITSRRRVWGLIRRSGAEGLGRYCAECRRRSSGDEATRVLALTVDAACGLLVADAIDDAMVEALTSPVQSLIELERPAAG